MAYIGYNLYIVYIQCTSLNALIIQYTFWILQSLEQIRASTLKYIFYQKSTNSGRYLHYTSHCAMSTKVNIIKSETRRVLSNCSDHADAYPFLEKIKGDFLSSGYPPNIIKTPQCWRLSTSQRTPSLTQRHK